MFMCLVIIGLDKITWRHRMKSFEKFVSLAKERNNKESVTFHLTCARRINALKKNHDVD